MNSFCSLTYILLFVAFQFLTSACEFRSSTLSDSQADLKASYIPAKQNTSKVIHVFVALCDNVNQGIVKVPPKIGNGQDPVNNLYWGAAYGVKSYFKKQSDWQFIKSWKLNDTVLERCVFKHKTTNAYLIADAYDGKHIKQSTINFLSSCAGRFDDFVLMGKDSVYCGGNADLITFIGHDGLMDFSIKQNFIKANDKKRKSIILACISKKYFSSHLKQTGTHPLLWSTGLMSPEAYTLKAAIDGWLKKESNEQIRSRAAAAYHKYQKCGLKGARNLLVTGW
jgi:hypothetical protein